MQTVLLNILQNASSSAPITSVLAKLYLPLVIILGRKFQCVTSMRVIAEDKINVCENIADYIFLQDIEDCAKYIVCINGQVKSEQCQPGLYFDARRQACTASKQNCLQCPSGRMINLPLFKTCDKYISCYYGQRLLKTCAKDQQFNVKTGRCDLLRNVDCVENLCSIYATERNLIRFPSAVSCSNYYICQTGQVKQQTCDEGLYFSNECNCCDRSENVQCSIEDLRASAENFKKKRFSIDTSKLKPKPALIGKTNKVKCPLRGNFLYQRIEDPVYYFACVEGKATLYACPDEFEFDDTLKSCVHKEKVKLLISNNDVNPESKLSDNEANNSDEISAINCPINGKTTMPHAQKNQYYLCIEGEAAVVACAAGLVYDASLKSCTTYNVIESNSEIYRPHENTDASISVCPKLGTFIFPHIQKNRYYICIDGNAIGFACDEGQVFDVVTSTCKNREFQVQGNGSQKPQVLDETVDILCPPFGAIRFAHKQKHKFYLCVNGLGSVLACAEGSFFEPQTGVCRRTFDLIDTAGVTSKQNSNQLSTIDTESSIECPTFGSFIYSHTEKNLYYVCLDGHPIVLSCPKGFIFDNNKNICTAALYMKNVTEPTTSF